MGGVAVPVARYVSGDPGMGCSVDPVAENGVSPLLPKNRMVCVALCQRM